MNLRIFSLLSLILVNVIVANEITIPDPTEFKISSSKIIGDFDGDGIDDILVAGYDSDGFGEEYFSVYSYSKKVFLLQSMVTNVYLDNFHSANLDNVSGVEILYKNKIYTYSGGLSSVKK